MIIVLSAQTCMLDAWKHIDSFHMTSHPYRNAHLEGKTRLYSTDRIIFTQFALIGNVVKRWYYKVKCSTHLTDDHTVYRQADEPRT